MRSIIFGLCFLGPLIIYGQNTQPTLRKKIKHAFAKSDSVLIQTIRGQVLDAETKQVLVGASIIVDSLSNYGTNADEAGNFVFEKVPVGRHTLRVSHVGYKEESISILLRSSKETVVEISMNENPFVLDEVNVASYMEMASLGSTTINTNELNRHAGNRGEAIRKVSVLPGIQSADDSRNDVIIRGNSPQSVSWRIEGVNVPNPNHFNIPGTSGGPVTIINDKMLTNSDFYSGAFPSQYGNTTSGIFDLHFKNGNTERHNFGAQVGLLGAELSGDGPLVPNKQSSYVFSARVAMISFFDKLNINVGTESVPHYSDLSFKFNFPRQGKSSFYVFGMGGASNVDILISQHSDPTRNLYGEKDRDQYFETSMGIVGVGFDRNLDSTGFISGTFAVSSERINSYHEFVLPDSARWDLLKEIGVDDTSMLPPVQYYNFKENRISSTFTYNRRLNEHLYFKTGLSFDFLFYNFKDSARNMIESDSLYGEWRKRWWSTAQSLLIQPFAEWKFNKAKTEIVAGLHSQFYTLTKSVSWVEPRLSLKYRSTEKTMFNAAFGLHSQIQQPYLYFYGSSNDATGAPVLQNRYMDFSRSFHSAIGLQHFIMADSTSAVYKIKGELYYQGLYNVPIQRGASSFSMINSGADFTRLYPDSVLVNEGRGYNYGIEITAERSFHNGYLFLVTGALYESKYKGSDDIWRDSDFNGNYLLNALLTKEWELTKQNTLSIGARFTMAGGRRYGPVDTLASNQLKHVVYVDDKKNLFQFDPYYRFDLRISYVINRNAVSHEFAVDIINVLNIKNVLRLTYIPDPHEYNGRVEKEQQLGILPFFYYRLEFHL